ncbi:MAG: flagellar hook-associated protein FlgL [Desulfovibrio sp.]|uniref:flagellar hook-associated protein FlgL n=1 Tax=Desulfovibrio sp. 7SRBS1 TaxID=3378064 RepID=UPI003B3BFE3C
MYRITQNQLYTSSITNMNRTLADLVESNLQASSEKKINRPSDDPVGMARVLGYRTSLSQMDRYKENISTATGWLSLADETLGSVSTLISKAKGLAEQAANGTYGSSNRQQVAEEVRQIFNQLIALSNKEFENNSIFAGHKTDQDAFVERLWLMDNDGTLDGIDWTVTGASDHTMLVQFTDAGNPDGGTSLALNDPQLQVRYSTDGGSTFKTGTITTSGGDATLDLGGVRITMPQTKAVTTTDLNDTNDSDGSWLWVRPTAEYLGDDNDGVEVHKMGTSLTGTANGIFSQNVTVRIDTTSNLDQKIEYSYSLDGGNSWVTGNVASNSAVASNAVLLIPGGNLVVGSNAGNSLQAGSQFVVQPRTADINVEISFSEKITMNSVGKDIFGGVYKDPDDPNASLVMGNSPNKNLFDVMGRLIGYLETNNEDGVSQCVADLRQAHENVLNHDASVAGRENRLTVSKSIIAGLEFNETQRMSNIEDVDISELMTKLAQQQIAYQAVLKSSSMIMNMSLVNMV